MTGVVTPAVTTTLVDQFTPTLFNAANNLLVLYNAALPSSVALKNYYLANRPGVYNPGAARIWRTRWESPGFHQRRS